MANEAALVAKLEVRLDKFEKQMKEAGVIADRGVKDIEDRFQRANPQIGRALGTAIGVGLAAGVYAGVRAIEGLIDRFKALEETARITGVELHRVFAIQQLGGKEAGPEEINRALERMNTLLDQAKRGGENSLSKLFSVNGADIKSVKDVGDLWERVADLVRRAQTVEQGRQIAEAAGAGRNLEQALGRSAEEAQKVYAAAESARPAIEQLARLSEDFNAAWKNSVEWVKDAFLNAWPEIKAEGVKFINELQEAFETLANYLQLDWARKVADALNSLSGKLSGTIGADGTPTLTVNKGARAAPAGGFSRPPAVGGKGGSGGSDRLDAFEREERRAKERGALMAEEARLVGATTEQRVKALEALRLLQMAEREEIPITDELRAKIDAQAASYAKSAAALESAQQKHRQFVELQNFAGNQIVDVLDRATEKGAQLSDIMADVAHAIKRAAIQALILGQGPLAGLFGTGGTGGQTGGLIGLLSAGLRSGIPGNAAGTNNWRGGPTWVGERGPELVNLPRGSQVIPNHIAKRGAGVAANVNHAPTYYITPAQGVTPEQLAAVIDRNNREFARGIGPMMARWQAARG